MKASRFRTRSRSQVNKTGMVRDTLDEPMNKRLYYTLIATGALLSSVQLLINRLKEADRFSETRGVNPLRRSENVFSPLMQPTCRPLRPCYQSQNRESSRGRQHISRLRRRLFSTASLSSSSALLAC